MESISSMPPRKRITEETKAVNTLFNSILAWGGGTQIARAKSQIDVFMGTSFSQPWFSKCRIFSLFYETIKSVVVTFTFLHHFSFFSVISFGMIWTDLRFSRNPEVPKWRIQDSGFLE